MGEVNLDLCAVLEALIVAHLGALIEGERAAQLALKSVQDLGKGWCDIIGPRGIQFYQGQEQGRSFHQHADLGTVCLADDQIAFPVAWNQPLVDRSEEHTSGL